MKRERGNVRNPMWRKKVDSSLFDHRGTTIPNWACSMWGIDRIFKNVSSQKDGASDVRIRFNKKRYEGHVTAARHGRKSPAYRLWFSEELLLQLKDTFLMSYMRSLEDRLQMKKGDIEDQIPFWEFVDIEYNGQRNMFTFTAHYVQKADFPELFKRLIGSPALRMIDDETSKRPRPRIYKQDWKPRSEYETEIGADNVVYMLMDSTNRLFYVGEARSLVKRLSQRHSEIPNWDFYRYDTLPRALEDHRLEIERMLIRDFASVLENEKGIPRRRISKHRLVNRKIDRQ